MTELEYVKATSPSGEEGNVHLVATRPLVQGRLKREAGDFFCGRAGGKSAPYTRPSGREEFCLEPCPKCIDAAEKLGITLGNLWSEIPGKRVPLYTTSPERRDRPYVSAGKVVGSYRRQQVRRVLVPEDTVELNRKWYMRDQYYCWDELTWAALRAAGVIEDETS